MGRQCATCTHTDRGRIELLLADGVSAASLAVKFGLHERSLQRHWKHHVSLERRAQLTLGPVDRMELSGRLMEESASLIDHYRALRSGLWTLFAAAVEAKDGNTGSQAGARLLACLDAIGRITGEIARSPLIQVNTVVQLTSSPDFQAFQARLIRTLNRFPEAKAAVMDDFRALAPPLPAAPPVEPPVAAGRVLEHTP